MYPKFWIRGQFRITLNIICMMKLLIMINNTIDENGVNNIYVDRRGVDLL